MAGRDTSASYNALPSSDGMHAGMATLRLHSTDGMNAGMAPPMHSGMVMHGIPPRYAESCTRRYSKGAAHSAATSPQGGLEALASVQALEKNVCMREARYV